MSSHLQPLPKRPLQKGTPGKRPTSLYSLQRSLWLGLVVTWALWALACFNPHVLLIFIGPLFAPLAIMQLALTHYLLTLQGKPTTLVLPVGGFVATWGMGALIGRFCPEVSGFWFRIDNYLVELILINALLAVALAWSVRWFPFMTSSIASGLTWTWLWPAWLGGLYAARGAWDIVFLHMGIGVLLIFLSTWAVGAALMFTGFAPRVPLGWVLYGLWAMTLSVCFLAFFLIYMPQYENMVNAASFPFPLRTTAGSPPWLPTLAPTHTPQPPPTSTPTQTPTPQPVVLPSLTPTPQPTATATPVPTPTPTPLLALIHVPGEAGGLNVRAHPDLESSLITTLLNGTRVYVIVPEKRAGGYTWAYIRTLDGRYEGWVLRRFLVTP